MGVQIRAQRDQVVSLTLVVMGEGGGIAGLTATVEIRRGETSNSYLDFADWTFKTSGWTTKSAPLTDIGGGIYAGPAIVDLADLTNLPAATRYLAAEYTVGGAFNGVDADIIALDDAAAYLDELRGLSKNRLEVNFTTQKLELYDEAGTTVIQRWPLATNGGENVATRLGVQTKRGVPEL